MKLYYDDPTEHLLTSQRKHKVRTAQLWRIILAGAALTLGYLLFSWH